MIAIFGNGKTAKDIALREKNCKIFDDKIENVFHDEFGNGYYPANLFEPTDNMIEIASPGVPPYNHMIQKANNVMSDYDFYYNDFPFSIWISGTNGKTTTTQMVTHLLSKHGAISGGNIGNSIASMEKAPIWVLETSSFTLHYTNIAKPNIYILLPITPDHITWHGSMDEYEMAKLKPLQFMKEGEAIILPKKYSHIKTDGFAIYYENSLDLADYFGIDITKIEFKEPFLMDAVMALAVSKMLYDEIDYELINSFKIDSHKIEEFRDYKNRLWIDDSKATNIDATIQALKLYKDKKIYLILGGDDKGADLSELFETLKELDVTIFAIGSNALKIEQLSLSINKTVFVSTILENAVKEIDKLFIDGVGLLSPAAASLDQFSGYKQRGDKFKEFVINLRV
ncbi:MAG: UDP-N-acetylmuramoyl-L-alanine--D-glutamate ligase [Campylobacterales bacterium]|nr:UDP-N-acetylmuramoyl-L-alanine--D-glutamate ligase [Campylobacterales bacterium]